MYCLTRTPIRCPRRVLPRCLPRYRARSIDILNLLLRHGASALATDARGNTAMHVAAYHGKLGAVEALIDAGGSVSAKNDEGLVPVLLASDPGHPALWALLVRGAAKNAARGLESFGLGVGAEVEAPRVRLRLSPSAFSPAPVKHDASAPGPAGRSPCVRYIVPRRDTGDHGIPSADDTAPLPESRGPESIRWRAVRKRKALTAAPVAARNERSSRGTAVGNHRGTGDAVM